MRPRTGCTGVPAELRGASGSSPPRAEGLAAGRPPRGPGRAAAAPPAAVPPSAMFNLRAAAALAFGEPSRDPGGLGSKGALGGVETIPAS
jgi:hypothetical protein